MKEIKLVDLALTNFKGIKHFNLDASGENVKIFGDNATGKTTIFDAFVWLLFDKDSQNQKDFGIKTLENGQAVHKLNHEVEATFLVNEKETSLKKSFSEKWTKKRGSVTSEFTGHTTNYYIDGVPSKKKEYTDTVADMVDEEIFKLLTSPSYFNDQLHWKKRRDSLLEIAGDVTDEDVIASNKDLSKLTNILSGRSIEDHRKVINAKRKEINDELDRIPVRVDEVKRSVPDTSDLNKQEIEDELSFLKKQVEGKEDELSRIRNGSEIAEKQKQVREIESQIIEIKNNHAAENQDKVQFKRQKLFKAQEEIDNLNHSIKHKERQIQHNTQLVTDKKKEQTLLRNKWHEWNEKTFNYEEDTHCPSCGQELPEERLESAKEKALAHFNKEKSDKLESIKEKGIHLKGEVESLELANETTNEEISKLQGEINNKQQEYQSIKEQMDALQSNTTDINDNPEYQSKLQEKQTIQDAIDQLKASAQESINTVNEEISKFKSEIAQLEQDKAKFAQVEHSNKRILQLEEQEKTLAAEFEQLEHELYLTEEFIRTKVNLLEEKINSKFKYARFNLFKENINGGLEEICETTFDGVPYSKGLNNAARINVGLDIINTLSEHYGVQAPIFVDNSEAVTKLIDVDAQVISLVVSENDKQLRIENDPSDLKEAI